MAKKKDEKVEETTEAPTEEVVDDKSEAKADKITKKASKATSSEEEKAKTASDTIEAVTGSDEEDTTETVGGKRAEKVGIVYSDKMTNTVVVRVNRMVKHQLYHKYMKKRKKFMAHDEMGAAIGDRVRIQETRPLSAKKRWRVVEIIQKAVK